MQLRAAQTGHGHKPGQEEGEEEAGEEEESSTQQCKSMVQSFLRHVVFSYISPSLHSILSLYNVHIYTLHNI